MIEFYTHIVIRVKDTPGLVRPNPIAAADKVCLALTRSHDRLLYMSQGGLGQPLERRGYNVLTMSKSGAGLSYVCT